MRLTIRILADLLKKWISLTLTHMPYRQAQAKLMNRKLYQIIVTNSRTNCIQLHFSGQTHTHTPYHTHNRLTSQLMYGSRLMPTSEVENKWLV